MTRFVLSFAGSTLAVDCAGTHAVRLIGHLFGWPAAGTDVDPDLHYSLVGGEAPGPVELSTGATSAGVMWDSAGQAAACLLERAGYDLASRCRSGLVFHAACVRHDGGIVLLPGPSGSGKSTLSTWLGAEGFACLGDELAFVADGTVGCEAFRRPLGLKDPARALLHEHVADAREAGRIISLPDLDYVGLPPPSEAGPTSPDPLRGILFPAFDATAAAVTLMPVSRARAAQKLLGCLLNARNLPEHGVPAVIRLASAIPAAVLNYGPLAAAAPAVLDWLASL